MAPAQSLTAVDAPPPVEGRRSRRKSARAAAAYLSAKLKEEDPEDEDSETSEDEEEEDERQTSSRRPLRRTVSRGASARKGKEEEEEEEEYVPAPSPPPSPRPYIRASRGSRSAGHDHKKAALSPRAVEYLKAWMMSPAHIEHPYPSEDEKVRIMRATGIELKQLTNWFVNNRKRYWKPRVEEMRRRGLEKDKTLQEIAAADQKKNGGMPKPVAVSSEDESEAEGGRRSSDKANDRKRKKYSTLHDDPKSKGRGGMARLVKKARGGGKQLTLPDVPGIHTASSHEAMKRQRKMSHDLSSKKNKAKASTGAEKMARIVSESSETESDEERRATPVLRPTAVCNPLEAAVDDLVTNPLFEDEDAPKSSEATVAPVPPVPAPKPTEDAALDYSISPLDNVVTENTEEVTKTVDATPVANITGFCCDGNESKKDVGPPCALCSACRDWNMGEFCPWDLANFGIPDSEAPVATEDEDSVLAPPALARATSSGSTHATGADETAVTDAEVGDKTWDVPQEIVHSASSADFMSSIETWD